ncbi:MAG: DUF4199 domain-containing protein [Ferruginibacter sp.]
MRSISARNKGIIIGVLMVAICLVMFYMLHKSLQGRNEYVVFAIYIAGICWSLLDHKSQYKADSFKEYFSTGFKTFIVPCLLMVLFVYIFNKLNPQIRDSMISENNNLLQQDGSRTPAEVQANADKIKELYIPFTLLATTIKYLFMGALVTLVGAGFLSSKPAQATRL